MLLLLACLGSEPSTAPTTPGGHPQHQATGPDPNALSPLVLPEELPFMARTRTLPCTLVDKHGEPLEVLTALGVEVRVKRLLASRALVVCTGCAQPIEGWVQRQALFVGSEVGDGEHDAFLATLVEGEHPAGYQAGDEGWIPVQ